MCWKTFRAKCKMIGQIIGSDDNLLISVNRENDGDIVKCMTSGKYNTIISLFERFHSSIPHWYHQWKDETSPETIFDFDE